MLQKSEIYETVRMIEEQNLDVRTVTLALSLFDCIGSDKKKTAQNVYEKICQKAGRLVETAEAVAATYGIPIVNKRVSVSPVSLIGAASGGYLELAAAMDRAAKAVGIDFIGGYSALLQKGVTAYEAAFLDTLPEALSKTDKVCGSVNVASSKTGINMDAVARMGVIVKELARLTAGADGFGCAKLVIFCNAVEDNPFMAGAFTGPGEGDAVVNVGVSGPGVVLEAIKKHRGAGLDVIAEVIKKTAFKITRVGQLIAAETAGRLGASFGIVDLSLAPTPKVGDSVAHILEEMGVGTVGGVGTTACLAILNDAVKKGGVMASSSVGGLSGAFIPVSEDAGMIDAVRAGALSLDKLEAMTSVCSVGLDMIAVPGDTSAAALSALIADECAIGMINNKTTAVRVIPAPGKGVGDSVTFGGLFGTAPVMAIKDFGAQALIDRGGRIPAPIHSLKN
ncbi:MAG: PFL family protein [Clostridiales bacterium]|jgi:uncharacterized protein (UPF0210 family)|nr:PFL family protein [Clostridiales bacterium]